MPSLFVRCTPRTLAPRPGRIQAKPRLAVWRVAGCLALCGLPPWAAAQTAAEAKAYFKELDDNTLRRTGEFVNKIYGVTNPNDPAQLAAAGNKVAKDIFDGFCNSAGMAILLEARRAHGKAVTQAELDAVDKAYQDLKDSGAMARLSKLQLSIMEKHFPKAGGGIDFDKVNKSIILFANGELRVGNANADGEMNQLYQWYVWKAFAAQAIQRNVDKAQWEPILKSLQQGLEVYRQVYPAPDPNALGLNPLVSSDSTRFDQTKQLNAAAKAALATAIIPLTTAQVLQREAGTLKSDTPLTAAPLQLNLDIGLASIIRAVDGSALLSFRGLLTDPLTGLPVAGKRLNFMAHQVGIVTDPTTFSATGQFIEDGPGSYRAQLAVPASVDIGIELEGYGVDTDAWGTVAVPIPEPSTAWLILGGVGALALRRPVRRSVRRPQPSVHLFSSGLT